jgi:hypothetical protein
MRVHDAGENAMRTWNARGLPVIVFGVLAAGCIQPPAPVGGGGSPAIGAPAPDIQGTDADGQSFKLSDYRGKVVMLDFWGNW